MSSSSDETVVEVPDGPDLDAVAAELLDDAPLEELDDDALASISTDEISAASRSLAQRISALKMLEAELVKKEAYIKLETEANQKKIDTHKMNPYLVCSVVEILENDPEDDDGNVDMEKSVVLKTSTGQTVYVRATGLVDPNTLKPGDLVGVDKSSHVIIRKLPCEYDPGVKAMEVDEKPTEDCSDIGGLEKQIQELTEAVVWPITHKERFQKLGIAPLKGVLLYGPPGTGKTLIARVCAAQTDVTFLKLAGPQLAQRYMGDGAKLVHDAFQLAKEKAPCIIFIDEIDAIGSKRFDSENQGDREVQRTMLALLNELDGFTVDDSIKVIAATNRVDILDPALMRSGRLDRKIEFPHPSEKERVRILQIHSRKMEINPDVKFEELACSTDDFNGAQLKAVCIEAGMLALRRDDTEVCHEDFVGGIAEVQGKKNMSFNYHA